MKSVISALFIEPSPGKENISLKQIRQSCPQIGFIDKTNCLNTAYELISRQQIDLIFLPFEKIGFLDQFPTASFELIFIGQCKINAFEAIKHSATGFIIPPFKKEDLMRSVQNAHNRLMQKRKTINKYNSHSDLLGIPTLDGLEYFPIKDIINCEGLQKCTRMVTCHRSNIVSSYNIGEFAKLLEPHGFFAPHKSYLINLAHVRKFKKDGTIYLTNDHYVPVARRRRTDFLKQIPHL